MTLGFIGTGAITTAIVTGLSTDRLDPPPVLVSPRNAEVAAALAARFANVEIARSNQDVLDRAETVLLAVRPQIAREVLRALAFRREQHVVSLIATYPHAEIVELLGPVASVVRAVPLPAVAHRRGTTAVYPPDPETAILFNNLGTAVEVSDEASFDALLTVTATMATYFRFAETNASWLAANGVAETDARLYLAALMRGLAHTAATEGDKSFAVLAREHATPGGINEQVARSLAEFGAFNRLTESLDAVLARIRARG